MLIRGYYLSFSEWLLTTHTWVTLSRRLWLHSKQWAATHSPNLCPPPPRHHPPTPLPPPWPLKRSRGTLGMCSTLPADDLAIPFILSDLAQYFKSNCTILFACLSTPCIFHNGLWGINHLIFTFIFFALVKLNGSGSICERNSFLTQNQKVYSESIIKHV